MLLYLKVFRHFINFRFIMNCLGALNWAAYYNFKGEAGPLAFDFS